MIFKPLKKKKKFGLNQTSTPSQSPTVNYSKCINIGGMHGVSLGSGLNKPAVPSH